MRIACVHLPQLSLQCATRFDPSLRGGAVVVVGPRPSGSKQVAAGPIVLACSRAAWALGARVGITASAARHTSPEVAVVTADAQLERETVRALADSLLALTPVVEIGGRVGGGAHYAMYCEVPSKTRGASFGERLAQQLEALGLTGRIGIADDRFTAWVAASSSTIDNPRAPRVIEGRGDRGRVEVGAGVGAAEIARAPRTIDEPGVVSVPRGGSAAFLAPRPLSLLAISLEVQHMLESLGVRTLGEFAALPSPSVSRPLEADYQALARGEGGANLRPYAPEAPIREEIAITRTTSLGAAVGAIAERVALRLAGRGRGAARLEIAAIGPAGERVVPVMPIASNRNRTSLEGLLVPPGTHGPHLISTPEALADTIGEALRGDDAIWRIRVVITGEALAGDEPATDAASWSADEPAIIDTLSVVLSNTGGSLELALGAFASDSREPGPTAGVLRDRPDAHRRTRRGKQRRRADRQSRHVTSLVQPKLFKS